ncbi:MAG TPA: amino acid adenylation domain-containing protein [Longimicrobium sp.]
MTQPGQLADPAAERAAALRRLLRARLEGPAPGAIPPADPGAPVPLSDVQQQLWLADQIEGGSAFYIMPVAFALRGALDVEALRAAVARVVERHSALRTRVDLLDGAPVQHVGAEPDFAWIRIDAAGVPHPDAVERLAAEMRRPFDLRTGPLLRVVLVDTGPGAHLLGIAVHHIVCDGWSLEIFFRELRAFYAGRVEGGGALPPAPGLQYRDFAAWQQAWTGTPPGAEQVRYWAGELADAPDPPALHADAPPDAAGEGAGAKLRRPIPAPLRASVEALAREAGATPYMVLLAAFAALLHRYTGDRDLVVGTPAANRARPETQDVIGYFANTLAVRLGVSPDEPFRALLQRARAAMLAASANQEAPLARVVQALRRDRSLVEAPLFGVMFAFDAAFGGLALPGVSALPVPVDLGTAAFDLTLAVENGADAWTTVLHYRTGRFRPDAMERMAAHFQALLQGAAAGPDLPVRDLPLLGADERARLLVEWNAPRTPAADACIHTLVEAQAARTPRAPALVHPGGALDYAELNARANRLAHRLCALGVGPEVAVGVCLDRSPEMGVALLAVLKAGGAYLPLDPAYPRERIAFMLADARVPVLLTRASLTDALPAHGARVLHVDDADAFAAEPAGNPPPRGTPRSLAYVIYTSGSTGTPKGVGVEHASLANHARAMAARYALSAADRVLQFAALSFDVAAEEIFPTWITGGAVVLRPAAVPDPADFARWLDAQGVTVANLPAPFWHAWVAAMDAAPPRALRLVATGSDAVSPEAVNAWARAAAGVRLFNAYGPTEATITAAAWEHGGGEVDPAAPVPIGRPVANTPAYVVDAAGEPSPVGVPGELRIGGAQVARGYLGRPALTAERFVPDPFSPAPGGRLYRTGDRARWRPDGQLEFLGRMDAQVKVRGFRIEPGEIESALLRDPAVRQAVVAARDDAPGGTRLVAYVVGEAVDVDALRARLRAGLPEHMVPSAFVALDALPLTPSGKVDRRALPAPGRAADGGAGAAPRTPAEELLAGIWAQVLGLDRVGVAESFFELGGHSLLATQVVSRVRLAFGAELPVRALFEAPTVRALAGRIEALRGEDGAAAPLRPVARDLPLPLSHAQQRLWFVDRMEPGSAFLNLPAAVRLRGPLDAAALERALGHVIHRHEPLRTVFREAAGGEPEQVILPPPPAFSLPRTDLADRVDADAALERLVRENAEQPFDLARGPLFRASLARTGPDEHVLLLCMHHVVSDGWSMDVLFRELDALYRAEVRGEPAPLPPLPVQYADYAVWQREHLRGEVLERQLAWWRERLAGAPTLLELPTDRPRPAVRAHRGAVAQAAYDAELRDALLALGRREGATLYMVLLAAFQVLLGRYARQDDVVVGSPIAGRTRAELEGLIGFFVNTLALRTDLSGAPTFRQVLGRVREATLQAYAHQELPFEKLVEELRPERSLSHTPLFQVAFALQNNARAEVALHGVRAEPLPVRGRTAKYDLTLFAAEGPAGLDVWAEYDTDLFDAGTIERMLGHFGVLLRAAAADPDRAAAELPLLRADERREVMEGWNATAADLPAGATIHAQFTAQAARTPDAPAVAWDGGGLSYAELDARANQLARHLRRYGVGRDVPVALCVERGPEMIVGALGVLKAGGAYVPLDPAHPVERLRFMLRDTGAPVLLTQAHLAERFAGEAAAVLRLDADWGRVADEPTSPPAADAGPDDLCYVIYTSGSTGLPKGVMVAHRALGNLVHWHRRAYALGPADRTAQVAGVAFDAAAWEIWPTLLSGAALHVPPPGAALQPQALRDWLVEQGITCTFVPTPLAELMLPLPWPAGAPLRTLLTGGDQLQARPAADAPFALVNHYGPTECTVVATCAPVPAHGEGRPLIGGPIANTRAYVLDALRQPVPVGVPGELYLGGAQLARGYLNRPALTAERFVAAPWGERLYRTGDLVRWRPGGALEFLGRLDDQVKVRGFRIELGEIESVLAAVPAVREAAVLAREDVPGDRRLVAYVAGDAGLDVARVRERLRAALPEYMVPAAFVVLDRLPLTPNGKVDRRALPAPERGGEAEFVAPRTPAEEVLADVWAQVLGVERVGAHDHFFDLGGHSLLATRVVSRLREAAGVELPVRALFEAPTLEALAREVERLRPAPAEEPAAPLRAAARPEVLPLSFAQQRLWFLDRYEQESTVYNIPAALRLRGALDAGALERALGEVVRRHESLRTVFREGPAGDPEQVVLPAPDAWTLPAADLAAVPPAERGAEVERRVREDAGRPFDLARGPLFRASLLRVDDDEHVLLLCMHHIVSDGWSMGVLFRELSHLYASFARGEAPRLPEPPVQYADYTLWQRGHLQGDALEPQLAWWRERLAGAPTLLELPTDRPRPAVRRHQGATLHARYGAELHQGLQALARGEGTTLYMVLLAAFQVLLGRHAGQDDVVVGSPIAGRTRAEVEGLIGFFVNTLVLRADLSGGPTFGGLLRRVRESTLGAFAHQEVPFETLVDELRPERSLSHTPLFQVMFVLQNNERVDLALPGVRVEVLEEESRTAKHDLTLTVAEREDGLRAWLVYDTDLWDAETAERMLERFGVLLGAVAADPDRPVAALPLLSPAERRRVLEEWNGAEARDGGESVVHARFEAQVRRTPGAVAVVHEEERLTYAALNARANQLAHHLRGRGVGPEVRVALCVERGVEMIVGLLGVLKAGGAYVALDPTQPAERLAGMLADAGAPVLLTQAALADRFAGSGASLLRLDADWARVRDEPVEDPRNTTAPEQLAYLIYTSGSTGRPKLVAMEHRRLASYVDAASERLGLAECRSFAMVSTLAADLGYTVLFPALLGGGELHVISHDRSVDAPALAAYFARNPVDCMKIVPSHLETLIAVPGVGGVLPRRRVVLGGDELHPALVAQIRALQPECVVCNHYGPTETTVGVLAMEVPRQVEGGVVPLGRPLRGVRVYVLDGEMRPVPAGVWGELYAGGRQIARGYLGRPALTAERFVPDPFGAADGERLYRTGDRVRWRADGTVEFGGRLDHQVKIRGFRIELGEVESVLAREPGVREGVVVVREDAPGQRRLVAYVAGDGVEAGALRDGMKRKLPDYMVPSAWVLLDRLPLTPNGKVDRRALPAPEAGGGEAAYVAPRTRTEEILAGIWAEVLRLERVVGVHENFFELGGNSLLTIRVLSRAGQEGLKLTPKQFFEHQTIAELAAHASSSTGLVTADAPVRPGPVAFSPAQRRFLEWDLAELTHYNMDSVFESAGPVDVEALRTTLDLLLERHDALRLRFVRDGAAWSQHIPESSDPIPVSTFHFADATPEEMDDAVRSAGTRLHGGLDLHAGPVMRVGIVDFGQARPPRLVLVVHHLVVDGVSLRALTADFAEAYGQLAAGGAVRLSPPSMAFSEWTRRQAEYAAREAMQADAAYWHGLPWERVGRLPVDFEGVETPRGSLQKIKVALTPEQTAFLLREAPRLGVYSHQVLLGALARAFGRWTGWGGLLIDVYSHGRNAVFEDIDLSRTVGWLTNIHPVLLDVSSALDGRERTLDVVRGYFEAMPSDGMGWGMLRYLHPDAQVRGEMAALPQAEVLLNFRGQLNSAFAPQAGASPLRPVGAATGSARSPRGHEHYRVKVSADLVRDRLSLTVQYSANQYRPETIEALVQDILAQVEHVVAEGRTS